MKPAADVVVIGGGIIGLTISFFAQRAGFRTLVVDEPRHGVSTAVAGGMLAVAAEVEGAPVALMEALRRSAALYPSFIKDVEFHAKRPSGFCDQGTLLVALHRDHVVDLEHLEGAQRQRDIRCQWLAAADVRELEPHLSPRVLGALLAPDDRQVNPQALVVALRAALERLGGQLWEDCRLVALQGEQSGVRGVVLQSPGGERRVRASRVVIACGAWTAEALPQLSFLPMRPVRGQVLRLRGEPLLRHVVRSPNVYLIPRTHGGLLVGATSDEVGFDARPTAGGAYDLLRHAWSALPGVGELTFEGTAAGLRPAARDHLPIIGSTGPEGLWVATGHYRHGVALAPLTAHLLVESWRAGRLHASLLPFSPARFSPQPGGT